VAHSTDSVVSNYGGGLDDRDYVSESTYHDDPDGSDRGGFHEECHKFKLVGPKLVYALETSDYYEERFGEFPETACDDKDSAVAYLRSLAERLREQAQNVDRFATRAEGATEFEAVLPEGHGEEDDDEWEDEEEEEDEE